MSENPYEGMSKEKAFAFRARAERELELENQAKSPQASDMDKLVGSVPGRFALGLASPLLGAAQLGANVGTAISEQLPGHVEGGVMSGPWVNQKLGELEASKQRGMKAAGTEGFDWAGLGGSLLPGAAAAKGMTALLPAATSAAGRIGTGAAIGGGTAAAQPVISPDFWTEKAKQIGIGAAVGGAIPAVAEAVRPGTPQLNPVQAQTLREGQAAGYVVPPSTVNPSFVTNRLESLAGKAAVGQEAAKRNQAVTNALVKRELGIPTATPITEQSLKDIRKEAGKAYEAVAKLRPPESMEWFPRYHQKDLVEQLKTARADANLAYKSNVATPHPDMLARAQALEAKADSIDMDLASIAKASGREDLISELAKARTKIAKSYDVERALNLGTEDVSAPIIGRQLDKAGLAAKSGNLSTIGKMAEAFPSVMREGARVPASGVSGTDAAASAILGTMGYGAGGPAGLLAAGLPLLRGPARNLVLSPRYQQFATGPGLSPQRQAMIEALLRYGSAGAGTAVGRVEGGP